MSNARIRRKRSKKLQTDYRWKLGKSACLVDWTYAYVRDHNLSMSQGTTYGKTTPGHANLQNMIDENRRDKLNKEQQQ